MSIYAPDNLLNKMCDSGICTAPKPLINFKRVPANEDGHSDTCKTCTTLISQGGESSDLTVRRMNRDRYESHKEAHDLECELNYLWYAKI
jgi:hypothetical protein